MRDSWPSASSPPCTSAPERRAPAPAGPCARWSAPAVPQHQAPSFFSELQGEQATQGAPGPREESQLPVDALQPRPEESLDDGVQDGAGQADEHQQQVHDDDHDGSAPVKTAQDWMDILYNLCVGLG